MAYQIRIKRSETPGAVPATLAYGELAFNFADGMLYIGNREGQAILVTATDPNAAPMPAPEPPAQPPQNTGYTATGVRRRLLPFE